MTQCRLQRPQASLLQDVHGMVTEAQNSAHQLSTLETSANHKDDGSYLSLEVQRRITKAGVTGADWLHQWSRACSPLKSNSL